MKGLNAMNSMEAIVIITIGGLTGTQVMLKKESYSRYIEN